MPASATRRSPGPWTPPAGPARSVPSRPITKPRQRPDMSINTPAPAGQHRTDPRPPAAGPGAARDHARRLRESGGTRLRLRALHVMGHGSARIARAAGVREMTIRALVRGDARTVSPKLRDKVTALYDAWWDKRAPEHTRAERGAATLARRRAIAGNWCAGAALDDDQLDVPGYRPRQGWKPAAGTGTAPGIRPFGTTTRRRARGRR